MALPGFGINTIGTYAQEKYDIFFNLAYQHQPYNSNYLVGQGSEELRTDLYQVSVAPVWKMSSQLHLGIDVGISSNIIKAAQNSYNYFLMPAMVYTPINELDIGISYLRVSPTLGDEFVDGPFTSVLKLGLTYRF